MKRFQVRHAATKKGYLLVRLCAVYIQVMSPRISTEQENEWVLSTILPREDLSVYRVRWRFQRLMRCLSFFNVQRG